jgi:hypothetical protein
MGGCDLGRFEDDQRSVVFLGISALLVAYLLYTMIRKRKGERPGEGDREPSSDLTQRRGPAA